MRQNPWTAWLLSAAVGCSSAGTPATPTSDAAVTDNGAPADAPATGLGDEYCAGQAVTCRGTQVSTCGVCVAPPGTDNPLVRTRCSDTQRREYCDASGTPPPNLSCFERAHWPTAGTSQTVTMWGAVRVFGNGGDSQHVRVTVYRVGPDGMPVEPAIGSAVSDVAHPAHGTEDVYSPSRDRIVSTRATGGYAIPNVPTETELVVVSEGDAADPTARGLWSHRIYDYNIMLLTADVDREMAPAGIAGDHKVRFNPRVIANADWESIPSASALNGITMGRGALAGEVHDCDDVRLSGARVESAPRRAWDGPVIYFSDNDTNPLPDLGRGQRGTSLLGTYALLDMDPGAVTVASIGYDGAARRVRHLGSYRARVFANAVTIVTLRGLRPWQVPHN